MKFDRGSGSIIERILFNNRPIILAICLVMTIFCAFESTHVRLNASFSKMIPAKQEFIVNFLNHYNDLQSQGNAIKIVVQANNGSILNAHYLSILRRINDQVYLLPNVDRGFMTSLWTPNTRWTAVTIDGIASEPVINQNYDGSAAQLAIVAQNISKTGKVGDLVANDFSSSMIYVPLIDRDGLTGKPINYGVLAHQLNAIRRQFSGQGVTLHVIGFAMVIGDMINAIWIILLFFLLSAAMAAIALLWYTRCIRSTVLVVTASLTAVVWQMGMLPLLGFDLTPYSVLVPFLVFSIGMSHGAQKMNGVMQDIGRGTHPLVAARQTFRRLFLAGFAALICDALSFAVLLTIQIDAIRELALLASLGVGILIFTNLIMLPILLSYTGVSKKAAIHSLRCEASDSGPQDHLVWNFLDKFTTRPYAIGAVTVAIALGIGGWFIGRHIQVGDLDQGAPELRASSQYNMDNAYIIRHYTAGSDTLVLMVDTDAQNCMNYPVLSTMSRLQWKLRELPGVQSTSSIGNFAPNLTMLLNESSPKWYSIIDNQDFLNNEEGFLPAELSNFSCSFDPIYISLLDHKAATLTAVVNAAQTFISNPQNQSPEFKISLAGGNAGIDAATNIVIAQANRTMLYLVYASVIFFCSVVFRSWRAVVCAVLPLALTSVLAQALMVWLGIGIKVATLPVMALGVGVGVDYALYVLGILIKQLRMGETLSQAYYRTLLFTGRVVLLTGFTLAAGIGTWIFAPIKFQADMGLLLSFMFLWNMLGALILLPSLVYFLFPAGYFSKSSASAEAEAALL